jgi:adenylate cyclase
MLGKLAPCGGGPTLPLLKPRLLVGRHHSCDLPLAYPSISARHCELELIDGYWRAHDLGSSNGTRVNDAPCTMQWLLPRDQIAFAKHCYVIEYTPPSDRPLPEGAGLVAGRRSDANRSGSVQQEVKKLVRISAARGTSLGELVPCAGGPTHALRGTTVVLGRNDDCDIVVSSSSVSGRHCQMEWFEGFWFVRDLGSRNGTRLDGVRCEHELIKPGSVLWVGTVRYRVIYAPDDSSPADTATPGRPFGSGLLETAGLTNWEPETEDNASSKPRPGEDHLPPDGRLTLD